MTAIKSIDLIDFFRAKLSVTENSNSDKANIEMLNLFLQKCQRNKVPPSVENLISYLRIYRKDSSYHEIDFSSMQLELQELLNRNFRTDDIIKLSH